MTEYANGGIIPPDCDCPPPVREQWIDPDGKSRCRSVRYHDSSNCAASSVHAFLHGTGLDES